MKIIAVDLETSGLDPCKHDIIEVGYVTWEDGEFLNTSFSMPFNEKRASAKALEVNGWGKREFARQISVVEGGNMIVRDFHEAYVVASPAHFDVGFLTAFLNHNEFPIPWGHRAVFDLKALFCGKMGIFEPVKNIEMARHLGVKQPEVEHTALGDAAYTMEMLCKLGLWGLPRL